MKKQAAAADWLQEKLANGPLDAKAIIRQGKLLGFTKSTLHRAKRDIGATSDKVGFDGYWRWTKSADS